MAPSQRERQRDGGGGGGGESSGVPSSSAAAVVVPLNKQVQDVTFVSFTQERKDDYSANRKGEKMLFLRTNEVFTSCMSDALSLSLSPFKSAQISSQA